MPYNKAEKQEFARKLRLNTTPAESALWQRLRRKQLGERFVRQKVIRGYIADFYCCRRKLAIEVDGSYHADRELYDATRDMAIAQNGIHVLRVTNEEATADIEGVLARIREALQHGPLINNNGKPRRCQPTNGVPIGIIIRNLRRQGFSQKEAIALAFKIAQKKQKRYNSVQTSQESSVGKGDEGAGEGEEPSCL